MYGFKIGIGILVISISLCYFLDIRVNLTDSMPKGIYQRIGGTIKRGDIATSCLTSSIAKFGLERHYLRYGWCATSIRPVMKWVYAIPGDMIERKNNQLWINNKKIPEIKWQYKDKKSRILPIFYPTPYQLKSNEYFLLSTHVPNSWDSRYFGPVSVEKKMNILWIWE